MSDPNLHHGDIPEEWMETPEQQEINEILKSQEWLRERLLDGSSLPNYDEVNKVLEDRGELIRLDYRKFSSDTEKWHEFIKEHWVNEIFTQEFVNALGEYLLERIAKYGGTDEDPLVVLEVGAGSGRLSHFLQQRLGSAAKVVATDSGKWDIQPEHLVEACEYQDALTKYHPAIVLCSWMPMDEDWSQKFREESSVREYILIGDIEITGCQWESWGDRHDYKMDCKHPPEERPPYIEDGFEKENLDDLSALQLQTLPENSKGTFTVSFRRQENADAQNKA